MFGSEDVLKIFEQKDDSVSNKGVCRTAPATPGLLITAASQTVSRAGQVCRKSHSSGEFWDSLGSLH